MGIHDAALYPCSAVVYDLGAAELFVEALAVNMDDRQ